MKKQLLLFFAVVVFSATTLQAQLTPVKTYTKNHFGGDVALLYSYGEVRNSIPIRWYIVDVRREDKYYVSTLVNLQRYQTLAVYVDETYMGKIDGQTDGWQFLTAYSGNIFLTTGRHYVRFESTTAGPHIPMADELSMTILRPSGRNALPEGVTDFLQQTEILKQSASNTSVNNEEDNVASKVLPNPEGNYNHAIDTNFSYSHFSYIYLNTGYHNFSTSGSTASSSLSIFNPANFTYSWANASSYPFTEAGLNLYIPVSGYYAVMLRSYNNTSGTTNIIYNGTTLVSHAVIGGRSYGMSSLKGGDMNFFTCRLTAGDTRMVATRYSSSSVRGYNDDYSGSGDWNWGYGSRIKKNFSGVDSVQYGYVCAYSPTSTGISDVYLGNENSNVYSTNYPEFPSLKADDAIKAAPSSGSYNCISWSGGITSTWVWPPSWASTYNCSGSYSDVTCFDNFYANSPVRYPGAWNYTRTSANSTNALVDLWALNGNYTHGSVRKPGNNHPHGYDWESKPGGLTRTFHPRNALTNLNYGYGAVVNYYRHNGSYARNAGYSFESDVDAVKAGIAVFDVAHLTAEADKKLSSLLNKNDMSFISRLNTLYENWKKTWETNAIYSDPAMYCKNPEYKAMESLAIQNSRQAMLFTFDKYVNEKDHFIGELLWTLTKTKYAHLIKEVKAERISSPNDAQGRHRIHGDHDNGVLYVEKILRLLQDELVVPVTDNVRISVSPNPVIDRLTVQVITDKPARISVTAISGQIQQTKVLQNEASFAAGTHRFSMDIRGLAGKTGDIIAVQVRIDGELKTVKVLVGQ